MKCVTCKAEFDGSWTGDCPACEKAALQKFIGLNDKTSSATLIKLELDCVAGEKIVFQRSQSPGAVVDITLFNPAVAMLTVQVQPAALLLTLRALNLDQQGAGPT